MPTGKVTVTKCKVRDQKMWVVYHLKAGVRKRSFFASRDAANTEAESIRAQLAADGEAWGRLDAHDRNKLIHLYSEAKRLGIDFKRALENAAKQPLESPTLKNIIAEIITAKEKSGRSSVYTANLKTILNQFSAGRDTSPIAGVTLANVEAFLDSKNLASRSTLRSRLSTLFKFAVRRGYRIDNPCSALEPVRVTKPPPRIFTIAEVESCLEWLTTHRKHVLPWFVLSAFCGLRPEEAEKTTAADIDFREGFIRVEAQTTKVRQRRVVYPKVEAMAMLKRLPSVKALNPQRRRRAIRALREHLGWKVWPKDITRHTAASYWLADSQSAAAVAESLGHSETVLKRNYKALVTKEQSRKFWSLAQT